MSEYPRFGYSQSGRRKFWQFWAHLMHWCEYPQLMDTWKCSEFSATLKIRVWKCQVIMTRNLSISEPEILSPLWCSWSRKRVFISCLVQYVLYERFYLWIDALLWWKWRGKLIGIHFYFLWDLFSDISTESLNSLWKNFRIESVSKVISNDVIFFKSV